MFVKRSMFLAPEGDLGAPGPGSTILPTDVAPVAQAETTAAFEQLSVTSKTGKPIQLSQQTIDKIKREQLERGKKSAAADLEKKAKQLGFESSADMFKAAANAKKQRRDQPRAAQSTEQRPNGNRSTQSAGQQKRQEREAHMEREQVQRERRERIRAQNKARRIEMEKNASDGHHELQMLAIKTGITDPEYAVELFTREAQSKERSLPRDEYAKWLETTDESAFFEGLRADRPYLFQEVRRAVTTGTKPTDAPPPGAGAVTQQLANGAKKDVKGMSRQEYHDELRKRGLSVPTS